MKNFSCFNELSIQPLCDSDDAADQRIRNFLLMWQEVRNHTGVKKVRHDGDMTTISLTQTMTLQDFINAHTKDPAVIALIGVFIHPQVDIDDDISMQNYIDTSASVKFGVGDISSADGFNAAYCQGTFCVGFESDAVWQNDYHNLIITSNGKVVDVNWACISKPFAKSTTPNISERKEAFDNWLQGVNPVLLDTSLHPSEKSIDLRDDHGKKELDEHAKLLLQHQNVEAILTSLPFKPKSRNYISKITNDGFVDVVLWWEDAGYSMRVKTTGRNAAETREIAKLLKEEFGRQK